MENEREFSPKEGRALREMLCEHAMKRSQEAQAEAAKLSNELRSRYGTLPE
jgi:hypothetical protein